MARGLFRKTSFNKIIGAYRSQWKRFWMRLFTFGMYGRKGMGWWRNPKKAWYNWWYHRTSISLPRLLGYKPSRISLVCAMLFASVISIFAAPVDAVRAATTVHQSKKKNSTNGTSKTKSENNRDSENSKTSSDRTNSTERTSTKYNTRSDIQKTNRQTKPAVNTTSKTVSKSKRADNGRITHTHLERWEKEETCEQEFIYSSETVTSEPAKPLTPTVFPDPVIEEPDPNTPKSKPKHENDQYISKRMIIAGSAYCDKAALEKLTIGTYFELVAEPTNPHDKDAIMLMHNGEKIGYVAKQDNFAFVTCLRLKRKIYGVITDIIHDESQTRYEYETWFDFSNT